jgi:SlyX protein
MRCVVSNTSMTNPNPAADITDQRITDLEIKVTYAEELVEQLEQIIVRQQQQIDGLLRSVAQLRQPSTDGGLGAARSLRDDLPPHF